MKKIILIGLLFAFTSVNAQIKRSIIEVNGVKQWDIPIPTDSIIGMIEYPGQYQLYFQKGNENLPEYKAYLESIKPVPVLKWKELKQSLFRSPLFIKSISQANPNAYSTLLKVLTDGEAGDGNEQNLLMMINLLGINFTDAEKAELNGYFEANNFTIRL